MSQLMQTKEFIEAEMKSMFTEDGILTEHGQRTLLAFLYGRWRMEGNIVTLYDIDGCTILRQFTADY